MKILKWIGIILVSLIVILLIIGLILPRDFTVERSVVIDAPKEQVFDHVAYFEKYEQWNAWSKLDSAMTYKITGEDGKPGAVYEWEGDVVGKGRMRTDYISGMDSISQTLTFLEPYENEVHTYYTIADTAGGVKVSWSFETSIGIPLNIMMAARGFTETIGEDFQKGLDSLKVMVERSPVKEGSIEEVQLPERTYLVLRSEVAFEELGGFLEEGFSKVGATTGREGLSISGPPTGLYFTWDEENRRSDMAAGMPVEAEDYDPEDPLSLVTIGPSSGLKFEHFGHYRTTGKAHEALANYMEANDLSPTGPALEEYITDPQREPDTSKWQTDVIYMVQ